MSDGLLQDSKTLTFIGGGNMSNALIGGLTNRGLAGARIVVADPETEAVDRLRATYGICRAADNISAVAGAQVVVLAVKPQILHEVAVQIAPHVPADALVVSIAAGIPCPALSRWLGPQVAVIRCMPNRPAMNGFGATALYAPASTLRVHRDLAHAIMATVGLAVWVDYESHLDTVTALSGSGPAYFFLFMEALETAAHARGLPSNVAHELTLQTALGAAQMAMSGGSLAALRDQVTSKGGTTAAALSEFEDAGLRTTVARALAAAEVRAGELAAQFAAS